jgi:hypothetical protein
MGSAVRVRSKTSSRDIAARPQVSSFIFIDDVVDVCKDSADYLVDEETHMPRMCTTGSFIACPSGYSCQKSGGGRAFCCRSSFTAPTGIDQQVEVVSMPCFYRWLSSGGVCLRSAHANRRVRSIQSSQSALSKRIFVSVFGGLSTLSVLRQGTH